MYIARIYQKNEQMLSEHILHTALFCQSFGSQIGLPATGRLCGLLHDMGKYSDAFQKYIRMADFDNRQEKIDHGVYGGKFLYEKYDAASGIQAITRDMICETVTYHHGGLPDNLRPEDTRSLLYRLDKLEETELRTVCNRYFSDIPSVSPSLIEELFHESCAEVGRHFSEFKNKFFDIGLLTKTIYSILVDADRLDSFLYTVDNPNAVFRNRPASFEPYCTKIEQQSEKFETLSTSNTQTNALNQIRNRVSRQCRDFAAHPTGIYTLSVPTGGGKTLSSLRFVLHHASTNGKSRIFYIMPYTTIVEQNAQAVRTVLDCGTDLLEFHSGAEDTYRSEEMKLISERFDAPIIFTTMVQFLNAFYAKNNANSRRLHNFGNAVLVFDEIQTLPIQCTDLFYNALLFLKNNLNTTSVLCSATQPDYHYIEQRLPYFKIDGEIIQDKAELYRCTERMEAVNATKQPMSISAAAEFIMEKKTENTSLLVILNTVSVAEQIYTDLKEKVSADTKFLLLTARLCPAHRKECISKLKMDLQKGENVICVSTQLIEAGVDISFSSVIRSLCGLDSIVQASGRGNRNAEEDKGKTYIVKLEDEKISENLKTIRYGQQATVQLLYEYETNPGQFEHSLFSPQAVQRYYSLYFNEEKMNREMQYNIGRNQSMIRLLSVEKAKMRQYDTALCQQFKTAAEHFHVIDSTTHAVIVPWNAEAEMQIAVLLENTDLLRKHTALKKLQSCTVSLYDGMFKALEQNNAFIRTDNSDIVILDKSFYDMERGVVYEPSLSVEIY